MRLILLILSGFFFSTSCCISQELTPRFYWPTPNGTKVMVSGYSYVFGDVLMDQSIPLYGVEARLHTAFFAYMQTFSLLGRTSNIVIETPYTWGRAEGTVIDTPAQARLSGFNDFGVTLAVNLLGAPSMSPAEFAVFRTAPQTILGASLKISMPTGQYSNVELVNVGANRWGFKPEIACVIPFKHKLLLEIAASAWFFTKDKDFFNGPKRQGPIGSAELHLVKRLKPGLWMSLDSNFFWGGQQKVGENQLLDRQANSKLGFTFAAPIPRRHALKFGYSLNIVTSYGSDFHQFLMTYTLLLNKLPD